MAALWDEVQKMKEILEQRGMDELVVHERMSQGKRMKGLDEKKKVSGWSMEEMKEDLSVAEKEDAEEVKMWRGLSQDEIDQSWKNLAERMEEELLNKYEVEESNKDAFKGRSAPLEWKRVRKNKKYITRKWRECCWARIFSLFREYNLQRLQSKQEESTEEEEMKQRQRMAIMKDLIWKIKSKGRMGRPKQMVGF